MSVKIVVVDMRDEMHEYKAPTIEEALTQYIDEKLVFGIGFSIGKPEWVALAGGKQTLSVKVAAINGLCNINTKKIKKIITNYTYTTVYPESLDFFEYMGLKYSLDDQDEYSISGSNLGDTKFVIVPKYAGYDVTKITDSAFKNNTSVTLIGIPDTITAIGSNAFSGCTNLKSIYFAGTGSEWKTLTKDVTIPKSCYVHYQTKFTGWVMHNNRESYFKDGQVVTNDWIESAINKGVHYYVGKDGLMQVSTWVQYEGSWYHVDSAGRREQIGWFKENGAWYYLDPGTGVMIADGWKQIDEVWYYFDESGKLCTQQWLYYEGYWYWIEENGVMAASKWINYNNKWYYVNGSGQMATNTYVTDSSGKYCYVGADGAWDGEYYDSEADAKKKIV